MFCPECGEEIPGKPTCCTSCGHKIEYPGDQDIGSINRVSRRGITLQDCLIVLALIFVLGTFLVIAASLIANIILPTNIPYSPDGWCDVCGKHAHLMFEVEGNTSNEFCWLHAVVYEMDHPAINFAPKYPSAVVMFFSQWVLFIVAGYIVVPLYGDFRVLSRDLGETSRQVYTRGVASVVVGLVIWLTAITFFALSTHGVVIDYTELRIPHALGPILRSFSLFFGFLWCSFSGWELMRVFSPKWNSEKRWFRDCPPVSSGIRQGAIFLTIGGILSIVSSTVLERGYLAASIVVLSGGIVALVLGFWPSRGSNTHPSSAS